MKHSFTVFIFIIMLFSVCVQPEKDKYINSDCGEGNFQPQEFSEAGTYGLSASGQNISLVLKKDRSAVCTTFIKNSECQAETVMEGFYSAEKGNIIINFTKISPGRKNACPLYSKSGRIEDLFRLKTGFCGKSKALSGHLSGAYFIEKD